MPDGGSIVATASLAGLTATPLDPIYSLTKHAVVGFVRSCAPQLAARGIRINALCPGFTDTPIVPDEHREVIDVPLMEPSFVAEAAMQALNDPETGGAWVVQPNRVVQFRFPHIPGTAMSRRAPVAGARAPAGAAHLADARVSRHRQGDGVARSSGTRRRSTASTRRPARSCTAAW